MENGIRYDYDKELDLLHIYNSNIDKGIKGGLSYGNFNVDIGMNDEIVGIELEGASNVLNMSSSDLSSLDGVELMVRTVGAILLIGVNVIKGQKNSTIQVNVPNPKTNILSL